MRYLLRGRSAWRTGCASLGGLDHSVNPAPQGFVADHGEGDIASDAVAYALVATVAAA
jgi:hypothetical protein